MKIERICSICGKKFKCECDDEMGRTFTAAWEIYPNCWLGKMKIVKKAKIEIVKLDELREGDYILWINLRCKVQEIDRWNRKVTFVPCSMSDDYEPLEGSYLNYYRLIDWEEKNICYMCGKEIEEGDTCKEYEHENLEI